MRIDFVFWKVVIVPTTQRIFSVIYSIGASFLLLTLLMVSVSSSAGLPEDPSEWACHETPPTQEEINRWCEAHPNRGQKASLAKPSSLLTLEAKNAYDIRLTEFLINKEYEKLGWLHDKNWRMTGPYVGEPGKGLSYGVHPAVRIYYSPEIVDWMCSGRKEE